MPKNEELENDLEKATVDKKVTSKATSKTEDTEKKTTKKSKSTKEVDKVVEEKQSKDKEVKKVEETSKNEVDEATVIDKIKNFIAKIVAMQEEAARGEADESDEKDSKSNKDKSETKKSYQIEYYDLPYRYNETVVKVLAQTPKKLFVYWDLADSDREKYMNAFGEDFFYKTYPVLLMYNEDKNYVREIPINDFANSWYIDIDDPKNNYIIQLGRKFIQTPNREAYKNAQEQNIIIRTDYLPIADSNEMEVPNDHVLLESLPRYVTFRNVKTGEETIVDLATLQDALGKNYKTDKFYNDLYKDEIKNGLFDMANPSSKGGLSSSTFK